MRKNNLAAILGILCIAGSLFVYIMLRHHNNDRYYHVKDSPKSYSIEAEYDEARFGNVRRHLDKKLGDLTRFSFDNATVDADVTLNGKASFYLLLKPGKLHIRLNKRENSEEAYRRFSELGRELEAVMSLQ